MHKMTKMLLICLVLTLLMLITLCVTALAADVGYINANGGLRFRTGPGTEYDTITTIPNGASFNIIGYQSGWLQGIYNGQTGWASAQYVIVRDASDTSRAADRSSTGAKIASHAQQYIGTRYVYGGASPSGFDCSGLVYYVYKQYGYSMNRTADAQAGQGVYVSKGSLIPGDLVFFATSGGSYISHVGIYIGNNNFVHATNPRSTVKINSINDSYYGPRYITARRIAR